MEFTRACHIKDSSNIKLIEYNPELQIMRVTFIMGGIYDYKPIDGFLFGDLVSSTSPGKFLNLYIKDKFSVRKVA